MKRAHQLGLHYFFYYLLAAALMLGACKKGDTGPQGEKGDTGAAGPAGSKGDQGTANVLYSNWLDLAYTADAVNGGFYADISAPKITDDLLSTGEIKVFVNLGTSKDKVITVLPFSHGTTQITPLFFTGGIQLDATVDASTAIDRTSGLKVNQYRYMLIPGGATLRMEKNIDWNNYEEVKAYLGLKD